MLVPPLGDRSVALERALRFGEDDPLEWPQLLFPELPHLACIRSPPVKDSDQDSIMWDIPRDCDFEKEPTVVIGISRLEQSKFRQLIRPILMLLDKFKRDLELHNTMPIIPQLLSILNAFLFDVEFSQNDLPRIHLCIRETEGILGAPGMSRLPKGLQACYAFTTGRRHP